MPSAPKPIEPRHASKPDHPRIHYAAGPTPANLVAYAEDHGLDLSTDSGWYTAISAVKSEAEWQARFQRFLKHICLEYPYFGIAFTKATGISPGPKPDLKTRFGPDVAAKFERFMAYFFQKYPHARGFFTGKVKPPEAPRTAKPSWSVSSQKSGAVHYAFDPSQPRDADGQWMAEGSGFHADVEEYRQKKDHAGLARKLMGLKKKELAQVKKRYGLWAGGNKEAMAKKISHLLTKDVTAKEHWTREARKVGSSYRELQSIAMDHKSVHDETVGRVNDVLKDARRLYEHYNGKKITKSNPAFVNSDYTRLGHFDEILGGLRSQHPDIFAEEDPNDTRASSQNIELLFDMLWAGNQKNLPLEDARRHALEYLGSRTAQPEEPIPFSRGLFHVR